MSWKGTVASRPSWVIHGAVGLFSILIVVISGTFAKADSSTIPAADRELIRNGNARFAADLYSRLSSEPGNLFFSPISISTALAMAYAGARGETADEMADVLHFTLPQVELHPAMGGLLRYLNAGGEERAYDLSIVNALWGQKGYAFLDSFTDSLEKDYGAGLQEVDFENDTEKARRTINRWVAKETKERIEKLLGPGILSQATRLVLTNAAYFKARWAIPFLESRTREMPFTLADEEQVDVPMMRLVDRFGYAEGDRFRVLELPYLRHHLSMFIFLPDRVDGLPEFESSMTGEILASWSDRCERRLVDVRLPKFKMTSEFSLCDALKTLGMARVFSPTDADFTGIEERGELFISDVIHKAFVEVDEEGTEAAAATAVVMDVGTAPPSDRPEPVLFHADHPFLFLIRDRDTGIILFVGRVADPSA